MWLCSQFDKRELAKAAGAAGLIELIDIGQKTYDGYAHYFNEPKTSLKNQDSEDQFVHLWMIDEGLEATTVLSKSKKIKTELIIEGIVKENFSSRNVVGFIEGSDDKLKDE